jgi:exodeoxyribonuclease V
MLELTAEQLAVVTGLVRGIRSKRCQTLGGYAGTGKTTCIRALKDELPGYAVCAFTGKAANVLRRKGIADATTIHSLIYIPAKTPEGKTVFVLRDNTPKKDDEEITGFIVDEASMVNKVIYRDLVSFGLPIIFVGDHGQLEAIGANANLMARPDYTLEHIHRNCGEIPRFAEHLRLGRPAREFRPTAGDVVLIGNDEVDDDVALSADQIICAFNKNRVCLNRYMRRITGRKQLVEIDERVMCLRNDHGAGLFNGMQGRVLKTERADDDLLIDFESYGTTRLGIQIDPNQFGKEKTPEIDEPTSGHLFDYAYVITAHKAQGDEWPCVLVMEQRCKHWEHKRWAYTAASRSQQRLLWVLENGGGR